MLTFLFIIFIFAIPIAIIYIIVGPKFICPNCHNKSTIGFGQDVSQCSFCKKRYLINTKTKEVIKEL